mmetsp:Transcript_69540/g.115535  ORF Transcript_69540/g.115535 Transcript_69540/m.115535 type:complete len:346 (+) Transcript_69540:175-1212(+)|eukprot:CAMPEP_0119311744 /NCGR_PEP_ID=MMETSP1333-20130426/23732_1 /TAXON_ID=418940 /ORGANISM="Scyphosphaera apsteinii, Strain RCC1455" /LENGTH=345 /DNA_ID=CAMNT_0007316213 /DNA_START=176 /DNA_END=1213 /DNA_ORIENTATION=+
MIQMLSTTGLLHLKPCLISLDFDDLVQRVRHDRVGVLSTLKAAGVSKLSERQQVACALGRHIGLAALAAAAFTPLTKQRVPVVVTINVHELPTFVVHHLKHVREHMPFEHRIVLNCNSEMHEALRTSIPDAFVWETAEPADVLCHPQPLNKRRFHGTLLQGIVRNMDLALRRWDFDAFLVLSSRSWFRRPLSLQEVLESRTPVPPGARRVTLRLTEAGVQYVDVSHEPKGFQIGSGGQLQGQDWYPLLRTRLANEILAGQTVVQGAHEGLVLERAACNHVLSTLDGPIGTDLYQTEAAVEEFALQSLAYKAGLRFAQLSDFGLDDSHSESAEHVPPITKTERRLV